MPTSPSTVQRCPQCGRDTVSGVEICPACKTILLKHQRPKTPAWFIALLYAIIAVLFVYIIYLCRQVFVLHNY